MRTTKSVDRNSWPPGPWDNEPDRMEFEAHGLPCLMVRQKNRGHWCGYVAVPPGHPLHGKGWNDDGVSSLDVHGGVTYARECMGDVCHAPAPGEPDNVWWLGFDCAHAWDLGPAETDALWDQAYRSSAYVRAQTEAMAKQLAEYKPEPGSGMDEPLPPTDDDAPGDA